MTAIILTVLVVFWVVRRLRQDVSSGMRLIFALLVFLPITVKIEVPAGLPQVTVHRILIVVAFIFLSKSKDSQKAPWPIPVLSLVILFGIAQLVSFVFGTDFLPALKGCFNYAIEVVVFYALICRYVQVEGDISRLLSSICYGLAAVAVVAAIEKYGHVDLVAMLLPSSENPWAEEGDIAATYPHRILLGYAMVMGVPLALAACGQIREKKPRLMMYGVVLLLVGATYFSMSRGPWLGLGIALLAIGVLGNKILRWKLAIMAALAGIILVARPGVRDTISGLYEQTYDEDSVKGSSYQTRWDLWGVAWKEIRKSPVRFLFGYGPVSTESMDLSSYWYGQEGWQASIIAIGHTSWDNNYASDLIELGVVGFALEAVLHLSIAWLLFQNWRKTPSTDRVLLSGICVACMLFMFAMTNVFIFAPQLKYLFWALVAVGTNYPRLLAQRKQIDSEPMFNDEIESEAIQAGGSSFGVAG